MDQSKQSISQVSAAFRFRCNLLARALDRYVGGIEWIGCLLKILDSPTAMDLFQSELSEYSFLTQRRYSGKPDGIAIGYKRSRFLFEGSASIPLGNIADRVALFAHLKLRSNPDLSLVVANTHLTFPHRQFDYFLRTSQAQTLVHAADKFCENLKEDIPLILGGDFNGIAPANKVCTGEDKVKDEWWNVLHKYGKFDSAFFSANQRHPQVSHVNHNNELVGVDHIFTRGAVKVNECFLEPGNITDTVSIFRPHVAPLPKYSDIVKHILDPKCDNFSDAWRILSDHRPITATFEID